MKNKSIHILYNLSAFLSDKTKGFPLFVKWKIAFGSLLIGMGTTSCHWFPFTTCYVPPPRFDRQEQIKDTTATNNDSLKQVIAASDVSDNISIEEIRIPPRNVTCYKVAVPRADENGIYRYVYQGLSFPGGDEAMMKFIEKNLKYPFKVTEYGYATIEFVVDAQGNISNPKALHASDKRFEQPAIDVILKMPRWEPAIVSGKAVSAYATVTVPFREKK